MSRKRDAERALRDQQAEARRRSNAHRSLRKRAEKRQAAADAGVAGGADASSVADNSVDEAAEAPTDTVVFARVPEFLRTSEEIEVTDGEADSETETETEADADAVAVAESDQDVDGEDDSDDNAAAGIAAAAVAADLAIEHPSEGELGAGDVDAEDDPNVAGDSDAGAEPEVIAPPEDAPASAQETTMVMEPVGLDAADRFAVEEETVLEATVIDEPVEIEPKKRRRWPWIVLVILLVLAAAYYAFATYFGDRVPANTQALGVEIGEMDVATATKTLDEAATVMESAPITLTAGGVDTTIVPSESGLSIDTAAMVEEATGFTLNPVKIVAHFTTGSELEPVVVVDDDAMDVAMKSASVQLDTTAKNATVVITGTTASANPGEPSVTVDHDDTAARIENGWPAQTDFDAAAAVVDADISDYEADRMVETLNDTVLASSVTLTGPNGDVSLTPTQFAPFVSAEPSGSRLEVVADGPALSTAMLDADPDLENDATDATLTFNKSHKLVTTESENGRALDQDAMGPVLVDATLAIDHTAPIAYSEVHPKVSSTDLGIDDYKEIVSSFSTPLTNEPIRTKNLVRAAEKVTGVTIMPGKEFNLADVLLPITTEGGYFPAHVIENGIVQTAVGGGLSQMATTTFNAGYFAGYEDIDHRPHSQWFPRYPAGRESTIYTGQINMVFKNNTPYAAVMSSYVKDNRVYVEVWSTPYFEVKTKASPKTNVVQPTTVEIDSDDCQPSNSGEAGFSITNTRTVYLDGDLVDTNVLKWTYKPTNKIVCT
ncbi:VanW family protein [Demequina aurantiaca]|uniref:VanW family protein n=1 Tax=Demequina aurantiaca TaxID=676200 RepID=UPI000783F017|nr:VanW family protein [Demequina aurantiaca]